MKTHYILSAITFASPCVLPLYPGFLAYIAGGHEQLENKVGRYFLGFFVLAGILTMMLTLGGIIAFLSISVGRALSVAILLAGLVIILLLFNVNPFRKLPQVRIPFLSHPFINAFAYAYFIALLLCLALGRCWSVSSCFP